MSYAEDTKVPVAKSRADIEQLCVTSGASKVGVVLEAHRVTLGFEMAGRGVRIVLPLPDPKDTRFTHQKPRVNWQAVGPKRRAEDAHAHWEQACRARWRALFLVLKAKLESIESGIETFEQAFLAHVVGPNGRTVGEWLVPQLESAYQTGRMPPLLQESNP